MWHIVTPPNFVLATFLPPLLWFVCLNGGDRSKFGWGPIRRVIRVWQWKISTFLWLNNCSINCVWKSLSSSCKLPGKFHMGPVHVKSDFASYRHLSYLLLPLRRVRTTFITHKVRLEEGEMLDYSPLSY
jgi:hypothetical protein